MYNLELELGEIIKLRALVQHETNLVARRIADDLVNELDASDYALERYTELRALYNKLLAA